MNERPKYTPPPLGNPLGPAFPNYRPPAPVRPPTTYTPPKPNHTGDAPYTPKRKKA